MGEEENTAVLFGGTLGDRGTHHRLAAAGRRDQDHLLARRQGRLSLRDGHLLIGAESRAIGEVLAFASLSTSLGATAGRGSGVHNICAEHGSCARLLAAAGARQPSKKLA